MFAMNKFNNDGKKNESEKKHYSENELLSLCYLSFLENNNYLKSNTKYHFGELVKSSEKTIF